jgi:hypothetical protein
MAAASVVPTSARGIGNEICETHRLKSLHRLEKVYMGVAIQQLASLLARKIGTTYMSMASEASSDSFAGSMTKYLVDSGILEYVHPEGVQITEEEIREEEEEEEDGEAAASSSAAAVPARLGARSATEVVAGYASGAGSLFSESLRRDYSRDLTGVLGDVLDRVLARGGGKEMLEGTVGYSPRSIDLVRVVFDNLNGGEESEHKKNRLHISILVLIEILDCMGEGLYTKLTERTRGQLYSAGKNAAISAAMATAVGYGPVFLWYMAPVQYPTIAGILSGLYTAGTTPAIRAAIAGILTRAYLNREMISSMVQSVFSRLGGPTAASSSSSAATTVAAAAAAAAAEDVAVVRKNNLIQKIEMAISIAKRKKLKNCVKRLEGYLSSVKTDLVKSLRGGRALLVENIINETLEVDCDPPTSRKTRKHKKKSGKKSRKSNKDRTGKKKRKMRSKNTKSRRK